MCGICGKISANGNVTEEIIRKMCGVLTHRGPDDDGVWVLDSARHHNNGGPRSNNIASVGLWQRRMFIDRED